MLTWQKRWCLWKRKGKVQDIHFEWKEEDIAKILPYSSQRIPSARSDFIWSYTGIATAFAPSSLIMISLKSQNIRSWRLNVLQSNSVYIFHELELLFPRPTGVGRSMHRIFYHSWVLPLPLSAKVIWISLRTKIPLGTVPLVSLPAPMRACCKKMGVKRGGSAESPSTTAGGISKEVAATAIEAVGSEAESCNLLCSIF